MRRHHFSMVSAGVLGGALALALTSSSFSVEKPTAAQALQPQSPSLQLPGSAGAATRAGGVFLPRVIVYYVISSRLQQYEIEAAVQSDIAANHQLIPQLWTQTIRDFVLIPSEEEERPAYERLRHVIEIGETDGFFVRVVDLR